MASRWLGSTELFLCALAHGACSAPQDEAAHSGTSPPGLDELRKQCENQVNDGCVQLASKVSKTQPDAAVRIFSEACDANIARGCAELGTAYADGAGLSQDGKRADEMFVKACRLDPLFCD